MKKRAAIKEGVEPSTKHKYSLGEHFCKPPGLEREGCGSKRASQNILFLLAFCVTSLGISKKWERQGHYCIYVF